MSDAGGHYTITIRPYQALCVVCAMGADWDPSEFRYMMVKELFNHIRKNPDVPINLRCNVGDVFVFQDPGTRDDTPEGAEYNRMRDLEVLSKLNVTPGETITARILFNRLLERIASVSDICGYDAAISDDWEGCPRAKSGSYERGRQMGIAAIIPPRGEGEMGREKNESLEAMYDARTTGIRVRPHILVCAVCQYGGGVRPPFKEDNLPELIQLVLKEPDTLITLAAAADWMMCAPCPNRAPELNACVNIKGSGGLTNQLRDLRTLQRLGMKYGTTMRAKDIFGLILKGIPSTLDICRFDSTDPSVWWDGCGARTTNNESYIKGREMLMKEFEF